MRLAAVFCLVLLSACGDDGSRSADAGVDSVPIDVGVDVSQNDVTSEDAAPPPPGPMVIGTWNLLNFSENGARETRTGAIAEMIQSLNADLLAVQEIKVAEGTTGEPPQAWDDLLERMPMMNGIHNPWPTFDTTVGLIYRPESVEVLNMATLFPMDRGPFPRPPLEVTVRVRREGLDITLHIVVLHLKAFEDSVDRRRAACEKLKRYIEFHEDPNWIVIGDFNDDPYDPPELNAFDRSFLGSEPDFHFLTAALPPESVSSVGWFHYVGDQQIQGEFLDHAILTGPFYDLFTTITPEIHARPTAEFDNWVSTHSDHFPVTVTFTQ